MFKIALTLFLIVLTLPAFAAEGPCEDKLIGKSFHRQGYEKLELEPPLTPEEAKSLHQKLVQFVYRTRPGTLDKYKIFLRREANDPIFKDEMAIEVEKEPELQALSEIQKINAWIKKAERLALLHMHEENPKVVLISALLEMGTVQDPMYIFGPLKKHSDNDYARMLTTLVGSSTIVHDDEVRYQLPALSSLLMSGRMRFAVGKVMATSHTSPEETYQDRLLLRMGFKEHDWLRLPPYAVVPETDVKTQSSIEFQPNMFEHGFEFSQTPISISKSEAQDLVNFLRAYYKNKGYQLKNLNLPVLAEKEYSEGIDEMYPDFIVQNYLVNTRQPTFLKIRTQVTEIIQNIKKYFPEDFKLCEQFQVGLRVGFKESPLYHATLFGQMLQKFHTDRNFSRMLAPLLGQPTEIFSPKLRTRLDIPMGVATRITGTLLDPYNATLHRVVSLAEEDRVLLVLTCAKPVKRAP